MNTEKVLRGYKDGSYDIDEALSLLQPKLLPIDRLVIRVAQEQVKRKENPPINTAVALLSIIEDLTRKK